MKERIKTLVLDSNGAGWKSIAADTVLRGILKISDGFALPHAFDRIPVMSEVALLFKQRYERLSYVIDWREALCAEPELEVEVCNINNLIEYQQRREAISTYPLIIILHSAAGDSMSLLLKTAHWFHRRRGKLVVFIGNEYDLMGEKFDFLRSVEADYVCSQLPFESARWLYSECHPTQVLAMPHALNTNIYYPESRFRRPLDIGFIGSIYPYFLGDIERTILIRFFEMRAAEYGLKCEVHIGNIPQHEWGQFLNTCKGIIGAESGSYYLDRRGQIIAQAKAYLQTHLEATFDEVFNRFFQSSQVEYVSGKCISSRHFEPIGTKTCQILLEGDYNGILKADEHYICVKKNLSNVDDAVRQFKDESYRNEMVKRTYEYVMDQHTYRHRIKALLKAVRTSAKN
jgi:hypothetical protein